MTLPLPRLDTLRYDQLLAEARDLLPYAAPNWTDYNAHDPGITLLELFAWLTEANSYRLDRLPAASERAFLGLLGYPQRPAQTARTLIAFTATDAGGAVRLPAGVQIATADGRTRFQTSTPFQVVAARLVEMLTVTESGATRHESTGLAFQPLGPAPARGDAFYLGFDKVLAPADARVRLFAVGEDLAGDTQTWRALYAEHGRARRLRSAGCRRARSSRHGIWEHYGARIAWEYFDGAGWRALPGLRDCTRALSLSGPLRFRAPRAMRPGGLADYPDRWFIRCRLVHGDYDCPPQLAALLLNCVPARHAADDPERTLGLSNGQALQSFDLADGPIVPGSTRVTLTRPDGTRETWLERPDLDRSGPLAPHYVIDPASGQVRFGDGRAGRVPEAGATLTARRQTGSGPSGNLTARSLTALSATGRAAALPGWPAIQRALQVQQPCVAWGGAAAETLGAAKGRAVRSLARSRCLVTLEDLEQAALQVPGVPVARARAVAELDPRLPRLTAAGCVTVVVVSPCVRDRPDPSLAMCCAVQRYLDARRPVATRVQVTGPVWTAVAFNATLRVRGAVDEAALKAEAVRRLDAFFDPLTGGPEGRGWPFGRPIYRTEVLALLDALPGVVAVEGLERPCGMAPPELCGNIVLCPHGLVRSGTHIFTVLPE